MTRSSTGDRLLLALVGLVALAAGAYGLARSFGSFGLAGPDQVLVSAELRSWLAANAGVVSGVATFAALAVTWAAWRWLRRQVMASQSSLQRVVVASGAEGRTSVQAAALTDAIVGDLESEPEVRSARARLVGRERAPALELVVELAARAELGSVRRHVEDAVLPRARRALDRPELTAAVRLRLGDPSDRALR
ncbi:MAG TPA: hypothetical protein VNT56_04245 [Acidimicrobiales bacterium]|nr:hypothetical protein [Acidimicrobiales bacterium]